MTPKAKFERDLSTLKKYLLGAECNHALHALDFAEKYHDGLRKDGITPSFHHQVRIALTLYNERSRIKAAGLNFDEIIAAGILHDTFEENQTLQLSSIQDKFSPRIIEVASALSKMCHDQPMSEKAYHEQLLNYKEALIIKMHDRRDNVETIVELSPAKQVTYIKETRNLINLGKIAIDRYPELADILQSSRMQLKSYINLYLGFARMVKAGKAAEVVELLNQDGLLDLPGKIAHRRSPAPAP